MTIHELPIEATTGFHSVSEKTEKGCRAQRASLSTDTEQSFFFFVLQYACAESYEASKSFMDKILNFSLVLLFFYNPCLQLSFFHLKEI